MLNWLSILLLFCSFIALAHFIFIIKYAVRNDLVIITALFTLLMSIGLFSWAMMAVFLGTDGYDLWLNISYLCALLALPVLIYLFIQRADSQSFIVTKASGRILLFTPLIIQLLAHFLLPLEASQFMDLVFIIGWVLLIGTIWIRLYKKTQDISSAIMKNQMEFMLSAFFVVGMYNMVITFLILSPEQTVDWGFFYAIGITAGLMNTARGIVKYQLVTGIELFFRRGLILMARAIFTVTIFIILEVIILSLVQDMGDDFHIFVSASIMVVIVLSMNHINNLCTTLVEWLSPELKWKESQVKEIFVILDSGIVLAHASRYEGDETIDSDLVGGMLSAIQNFLGEAFDASEKETLQSLRMGDLSMLLEHHGSISIAVLFNGFEARELRTDIKRLSLKIHEDFDDILRDWDGTLSKIKGIQIIVNNFMEEGSLAREKHKRKHSKKTRGL